MLKNTINLYHKIDISTYLKLRAFLKNKNKGHKKKKSKVFTPSEVKKFVEEAPDTKWLAVKVVLILGISGACRRVELWQLSVDDIIDNGSCFLIEILETETDKPSRFAVVGPFYNIVKKYWRFRPPNHLHKNFFLKYQNGKCHRQNIGIHSIGAMPKAIALHLQLPNPELYTGHSFRRSSATVYVNSGANITDLKRHGGWNSDTVAEGYIEESEARKMQVGHQITNAIFKHNNLPPVPPNNIPLVPSSNVLHVPPNNVLHVPPNNVLHVPPNTVPLLPPKKRKTMHHTASSTYTVPEVHKENVPPMNVIRTKPSSTITTQGGITLPFENCNNLKIFICEARTLQQLKNVWGPKNFNI